MGTEPEQQESVAYTQGPQVSGNKTQVEELKGAEQPRTHREELKSTHKIPFKRQNKREKFRISWLESVDAGD